MLEVRKVLVQKVLCLLRTWQRLRHEAKKAYDWDLCARPSQKEPPQPWRTWLILAGRGFGKTRTGAETIRSWVQTKKARRICLLAHTLDEGRRVMVEGASGLLAVHPSEERPTFYAGKGQLLWSCGATAQIFSAASYEKLRGPQFDGAWVDELAKFPHTQEAWDQLMMGLRLGDNPNVIVTTTPRPIPLIKKLLKSKDVVVTRGSTFENKANLSSTFIDQMDQCYADSLLGQQEILGEMVENNARALWSHAMLKSAKERFQAWQAHGVIEEKNDAGRCVVALDPAVTGGENSDETGIIVARQCIDEAGHVQGVCVLKDASMKGEPIAWMQRAVDLYHTYEADCLVAEVNNGGDLVKQLLHTLDPTICYKPVRAARGKWARAEPVAALYTAGKVAHAPGLQLLEQQMCSATITMQHAGMKSPDRLDALVWALFELCLSSHHKNDQTHPVAWSL